MAQVTVTIDGKAYRMACDEGQEAHLVELATRFDRYVGHLKSQFGEIGDLRITVMAGIMVMDEMADMNRRISVLEDEIARLREGSSGFIAEAARQDEAVTDALGELADRLNSIAQKLSSRPAAAPAES